MVGFQYGYDRRSNRLFEKDTYLGTVGSKPLKVDALLQYDGLDRVVDFQRGMLNLTNDSISSANLLQDWTLDQTGNWKGFNEQVPSVRDLNQTRTHNDVNEISGIAENAGQIVWADPTHDANGNMTVIPKPSDLTAAYTATWDAWNRLVSLTDNGEVVAAYQYDGTNRRIVVADNATVAGIATGYLASDIEFIPEQWNGAANAGEFDATGSYFTTEAGTVNIGDINRGIGVDDNATGSGFMMYSVEDVHSRFTVNQYNADHLVAVRLNGTQWQYNTNAAWVNFTPVSSDRLLAEVDFTANTVINRGWRRVYYSLSAQALEERLGSQVHQQYIWGLRFVDDLILRDRDSVDDGILDERLYAMHDLRFSIVAVANASGVVQERYTYDAYGIRTVMDALFVEQSATDVDWQFAYTGRRLDSATGLYFFRARYYSAELGRFVGRDPLGFVDGMNLYRAYFVPNHLDPYGMLIRIQDLEHDTESFPGHEVVWTGTIQHYYKGLDCFGRKIYEPPLWVDTLDELKEWINRDTTSGLPIPPDCCGPSTLGDFLLDIYDCTRFGKCVATTIAVTFLDDPVYLAGGAVFKKVRKWAASDVGKAALKKFGLRCVQFATLYAIWMCRHHLDADGNPIDDAPPSLPQTPDKPSNSGGGLGYNPRHQPWGFGPKW